MTKNVAIPSQTYRWVMLFGVWLIYFCFGLTVSALAPLVRPITEDLSMSYAAMGSVLGAWQLIYIGTALPCGALIDRFGLRRSLLMASLLMGASALLRSQAEDYMMLLVAVALFGLGGPLISIGAPKLVSLWFEGPQKGLAMGLYVTGPALGSIAALSLTNSVAMPFFENQWRSVIFIYGVIVLLSGVVWWAINLEPGSQRLEQKSLQEARPAQWGLFLRLSQIRAVQYVLLISIGIFLYNHGLSNWLHEILMTRVEFRESWSLGFAAHNDWCTRGTTDSPQGNASLSGSHSNCSVSTGRFCLSLLSVFDRVDSTARLGPQGHHSGFDDDNPVACVDRSSRGRC